ncbi:hypothetical protein PBI_JACE_40 [Gordonia phage Jace]|uniref:Uncharacterized protein n=1 Tax=Gordonia phage Jace TaxID=2182360 RepID=A0A2U8UJ67_9CAUD|nr:hypothetical protein HOT28_gp40 [Gordonia phage Jace]AWN03660.1 hypothetical protein PBI_JACE_40 [Gordonia phage Jace]
MNPTVVNEGLCAVLSVRGYTSVRVGWFVREASNQAGERGVR